MMTFELVDEKNRELVNALVNAGILRKVEFGPGYMQITQMVDIEEAKKMWPDSKIECHTTKDSQLYTKDPAAMIGGDIKYNLPRKSEKSGVDIYLSNGLSLEGNIEDICRSAFGFAEEKKYWTKNLKVAVKEYGHDEVLSGFYNWCEVNSNSVAKYPISNFLKNIGSNIIVKKSPEFGNKVLDDLLKNIAYETDGKILFGGTYKAKLVELIGSYGVELVFAGFKQFYANVTEKDISYAPKNFLEQAYIIIPAIKMKRAEKQQNDLKLQEAYKNAQSIAYIEPEEDLEEL